VRFEADAAADRFWCLSATVARRFLFSRPAILRARESEQFDGAGESRSYGDFLGLSRET
jgi:hypothetical protein